MTLFQTQKSRSKKLLEGVLAIYVGRMLKTDTEKHEEFMYQVWISGASKTVLSLLSANGTLKDAWGKGEERKAKALLEVFTLAMMSRWFRAIEIPFLVNQWGYSEEQRLEFRQTLARHHCKCKDF